MTETSRLGTSPAYGIKKPVVAATTANITLSGEQTIDTVSVVAGNRVLVKDQTDTTENGIYVCASGTWARATDFNDQNDVANGTMVLDANSGTVYDCSFTGTYSAGTTSVTWSDTGTAFAATASAAQTAAEAAQTAAEAARDDLTGDIVGGDAGKPMGVNPGEDGFVVLDVLPDDFVTPAQISGLSISGGDAAKVVVVNGSEDGIEVGDLPVSSAETADTIAKRDANGRIKVADPSAAQDAASKTWTESYVEGLLESSSEPSGYVKSVSEYIRQVPHATSFDVDSNLTIATYETVGPTGSGADNIWTALDEVPSGAVYVKLKISIAFYDTGGAGVEQMYVGLGYSGANDAVQPWLQSYQGGTLGTRARIIITEKVPVSSNVFTAAYAGSADTPDITLELIGYGA